MAISIPVTHEAFLILPKSENPGQISSDHVRESHFIGLRCGHGADLSAKESKRDRKFHTKRQNLEPSDQLSATLHTR